MEGAKDTYKTIDKPSPEILYKDRKSKFYGYVFPLTDASEVKLIIETLKKKHHTANHVCYAWQLGTDQMTYRANDDGEPNNSAGMPIYGQIQAYNVTNVLVAVVRIFGGTKLGVGGLISAYKTSAQLALKEANIVEKIVSEHITIQFEYADMDKVMRIVKQHQLSITDQELQENCKYTLSIRKSIASNIWNLLEQAHYIKVLED